MGTASCRVSGFSLQPRHSCGRRRKRQVEDRIPQPASRLPRPGSTWPDLSARKVSGVPEARLFRKARLLSIREPMSGQISPNRIIARGQVMSTVHACLFPAARWETMSRFRRQFAEEGAAACRKENANRVDDRTVVGENNRRRSPLRGTGGVAQSHGDGRLFAGLPSPARDARGGGFDGV